MSYRTLLDNSCCLEWALISPITRRIWYELQDTFGQFMLFRMGTNISLTEHLENVVGQCFCRHDK